MDTTEDEVRNSCEFLQGIVSIKMSMSRHGDKPCQVAVLVFSKREYKDDAMKKLVGLV